MQDNELNDFGFRTTEWRRLVEAARKILIEVARREDLISYSDLLRQLPFQPFDPHDPRYGWFLAEISTGEDSRGAPLLSVLVVHKDGDGMPGGGFFELAAECGYEFDDKVEFWIEHLRKTHEYWKGRPKEAQTEADAQPQTVRLAPTKKSRTQTGPVESAKKQFGKRAAPPSGKAAKAPAVSRPKTGKQKPRKKGAQ